jgi:hypothetical protein
MKTFITPVTTGAMVSEEAKAEAESSGDPACAPVTTGVDFG